MKKMMKKAKTGAMVNQNKEATAGPLSGSKSVAYKKGGNIGATKLKNALEKAGYKKGGSAKPKAMYGTSMMKSNTMMKKGGMKK
jgi:hypothetical protein